jgi:hypothetical protein
MARADMDQIRDEFVRSAEMAARIGSTGSSCITRTLRDVVLYYPAANKRTVNTVGR